MMIRFVDERQDEQVGAAFLGGIDGRAIRLRRTPGSGRQVEGQIGHIEENCICGGATLERVGSRSHADTWCSAGEVFVNGDRESGLKSRVRALLSCGPMMSDLRFAWRALWK